MGKDSGIEWTKHTWNPWTGCRHVSSGCAYCYMFRDMARYGKNPLAIVRTSDTTFNAPLKWHDPEKPSFVFTCSWSDWFIDRADEWRDDAWKIIKQTPYLTYQILTKRPERIAQCLPSDWGRGYPNVWLGVSAEDQKNADRRIPILLSNRAKLYFVSYEPALGPVDFTHYLPSLHTPRKFGNSELRGRYINWIICGGESGPKARPMDLDWARSVRDLCEARGVPFFLKQLGGVRDKLGGNQALLDGRLWNEMPMVVIPDVPPAPSQLNLFGE